VKKKGRPDSGRPLLFDQQVRLAGFLHSPSPYAARTHFHAPYGTILYSPDLLQIRLEDLLGFIMRMADIAASYRFLSTDITYVRHLFFLLMRSEQEFLA
jgi:hypothetical protein